MVKLKSTEYLLFLDGVIYEFNQHTFSEEHYPLLAGHLSTDLEGTLALMNGEYILLFVNHRTGTVWLIASESGNAALFYRQSTDLLSFGNSVAGVLPEGEGAGSIDFQRIYDVITGNELGSEKCCFASVKRLLPGQYIRVEQGRVTLQSYSKLFEVQPLEDKARDLNLHFRDTFRGSVLRRSGAGRMGIALSSGRDSTAIAAIAAREAGMGGAKIHTYTFTPSMLPSSMARDPRFNEGMVLKSLFDRYPALEPGWVEPAGNSVLESLEHAVDIYQEPIYGVSNQFWIQEMHRMVAADNCTTLLTGQCGNYTVSWPPPGLLPLRQGPVKRLFRGKGRYRVSRGPVPYLSGEFLLKVNRGHFMEDAGSWTIEQMQRTLLKNCIAYTGYLQKQASLHYGIRVTDPTVDKELLKFCLELPFRAYHNRSGSRLLVTKGLREMLPESILKNPVRGVQASDIQYRLANERKKFIEILEFLNKNKLVTFVIDTEGLARDWKSMDFSGMKRKELNHLLRIIMVGIFLSRV